MGEGDFAARRGGSGIAGPRGFNESTPPRRATGPAPTRDASGAPSLFEVVEAGAVGEFVVVDIAEALLGGAEDIGPMDKQLAPRPLEDPCFSRGVDQVIFPKGGEAAGVARQHNGLDARSNATQKRIAQPFAPYWQSTAALCGGLVCIAPKEFLKFPFQFACFFRRQWCHYN